VETTITGDTEPSYASTIFARDSISPSVLVADGHAVKIAVRHAHLVIDDGLGSVRRVRRIPRIPREVTRIVVLSGDGFITLDAIRWCADLGIGIYQYDRDGRCLIASPGQEGDARLRRIQALADLRGPNARTGTLIMNRLTEAKLRGQADCVRDIFHDEKIATAIEQSMMAMHGQLAYASVTGHEGKAAARYWSAWRGNVHIPFPVETLADIPAHWLAYDGRVSEHNINSHNSRNRDATNPVNAMLNYAYSVLETEAIYACHVLGLDPDLGITHPDRIGRHGMALDLMEPARPYADRAVLSLLDHGVGVPYLGGKPAYIKPLWFCESRTGVCQLVAPLTHMIAERVIPAVASVLAVHAEMCARELGFASRSDIVPGRPLSVDKRMRTDPRARPAMSPELTPADIVPDAMWKAVLPLIPPEPVVLRPSPFRRADARATLAGIICHELYGIPWSGIPTGLGVDRKTCQRRLREWQGAAVWDGMLTEIRRAGKPAQLTA
jgi:CRISP-associated protein Cas1